MFEYKGTGKVVLLTEAWAALTMDIITYYSFALSYDFLDYPDFIAPFTQSIGVSRIQETKQIQLITAENAGNYLSQKTARSCRP